MSSQDNNKTDDKNSKFTRPELSGLPSSEDGGKDYDRLIHDLQIYQAELEVQNEELRKMQHQLEISRNKYFELFFHAPVGYMMINNRLIIEEVNVAALALLEASRSEVERAQFYSALKPRERSELVIYIQDTMGGEKTGEITVEIQQRDKAYKSIRINSQLFENSEHEKRILLTLTDVTELNSTKTALEESENLYSSLIQSSDYHIFMLSAEGFFLASNNKADTAFFGGTTIQGSSLQDIYPADYARNFNSKVEYVTRYRRPTDFELFAVNEKNEKKSFSYRLYPIEKNGYLSSIGGFCADITDSKKAEQEKKGLEKQLRQAQKLESLGNLAGGIAHDFNNILASILGFSELALQQVDKGSTLYEDIGEIYNGGMRAKDLVQQILVFARRSHQETGPIRIADVAGDVVKFMRSTIPANITISKEINSTSYVIGNETQFHQIFMNILTNAAHALEETGGEVNLKMEDIKADQLPVTKKGSEIPTDWVEITICDDGPGMDESLIQQIFDPYFTTKEVGKGSGMGLAVVHGIVQSVGGLINATSDPGEGSCFTVHLPRSGSIDPEAFKRVDERLLPTGYESILVIDDEETIARVIRKHIESLGYTVVTFTDSTEAYESLKENPYLYDLVLSDISMPGITGDKLAEELLKMNPDLPIILCTGFNKRVSEEDIKRMGVKALLFKPVNKAELANTIRNILDGHPHESMQI